MFRLRQNETKIQRMEGGSAFKAVKARKLILFDSLSSAIDNKRQQLE